MSKTVKPQPAVFDPSYAYPNAAALTPEHKQLVVEAFKLNSQAQGKLEEVLFELGDVLFEPATDADDATLNTSNELDNIRGLLFSAEINLFCNLVGRHPYQGEDDLDKFDFEKDPSIDQYKECGH